MEYQLTYTKDAVSIHLRGRFDFNAHRDFEAARNKALNSKEKTIALNMAHVEYLDSSALGMILITRDLAKKVDKEVALEHVVGSVRSIIEVANFEKLFRIT